MTDGREPAAIFEGLALTAQWSHLWVESQQWDTEATREPEPWNLAGPPPLRDLMNEIARRMPLDLVRLTEDSVVAERVVVKHLREKEVTDEHSDDERCPGDADVSDQPGGHPLVEADHGDDPAAAG